MWVHIREKTDLYLQLLSIIRFFSDVVAYLLYKYLKLHTPVLFVQCLFALKQAGIDSMTC